MASTQTIAPATPWGYQRLLRGEIQGLPGVSRLGGPRRWWFLGGHAPGLAVFFDDDDRVYIEVRALCAPGADPRMLGLHIQRTVVERVTQIGGAPPAAVYVVMTPEA